MTSPTTSSRQRIYNSTGQGYESGRYGERHMTDYRTVRNDTLRRICRENFGERPLRILEVGCGTGLSLQFLAQDTVRHTLFGMDASLTMLLQAAQKASAVENSPKLALADAARLPYATGQFDVLFATRFIHQFPHEMKRQLWAEFQRVVKSQGVIIVEFYARPYHWLRYQFGAGKGKSREEYFFHYPTRKEVEQVVGQPFRIYPLRLAGARLMASFVGSGQMQRLTEAGGRALGGLLLDEYFLAARTP